jgi:OOP family OmpA-OmpF porin
MIAEIVKQNLTKPTPRVIAGLAFALAALLCFLAATWGATVIERRSASAVRGALVDAGHLWASADADGLQVVLTGEAPDEASRLRALSVAGSIVDGARVVDAIGVAEVASLASPDFVIEVLRNEDGISLIGLVPETTDRAALIESLTELAGGNTVADMLGTADYPAPENWQRSLDFALAALKILPRSKISVSPDKVAVTAISDSAAEKARLEFELTRRAPASVRLTMDISAPRPVITPFTLRFLIDEAGARFDACSADTEAARAAIIAAAVAAGVEGQVSCTIGLGVPSPAWSDAVVMAIRGLSGLGSGSVTFSDADIAMIVPSNVAQQDFDRAVGELESNLPEVFALQAVRTQAAEGTEADQRPEFTAILGTDGNIQLRGRITDDRLREAVESFARARFGADAVFPAMRVDEALPDGWPLRVLAALEALGELNNGSVLVREEMVSIKGTSGSQDTSDRVARILSDKLGTAGEFDIAIRYDEGLDPLASLPTPEECAASMNAVLAASKITFDPGSATITRGASGTLDKLAQILKGCADVQMEVGGHTDAQGREEMNQSLSQARAQAVIAAMMERRVLTGNLSAKGYGESVPIADNETEAGREANRRIEFRLLTAAATVADEADGHIAVQTPGADTLRPKLRPGGG